MLELIRIDDRLIHGQVAIAWTKELKVNCLLIANDLVVKDDFKKMTLSLAKPAEADLYIKSIEDAISMLNGDSLSKYKVLVIVENSADALRLIKGVNNVKQVNIGGMRMKPGKKMISSAVAVDSSDISNFKEIAAMGIEVEIRQVPSEKKVFFSDIIKE